MSNEIVRSDRVPGRYYLVENEEGLLVRHEPCEKAHIGFGGALGLLFLGAVICSALSKPRD